jgi:N6-adenosine-specific RNA methylase IME4
VAQRRAQIAPTPIGHLPGSFSILALIPPTIADNVVGFEITTFGAASLAPPNVAQKPSGLGYWPFATISLEKARALDVGSIMVEDSILWFWATNFHLRYAFEILDAWGFHETPTMLTWAKDRMGMGHWLRGQTKHAIMAVRGKPIVTLTNQTTLLHAPVRGRSVKPKEFYDLVEVLSPAPRYADLFSRYRHNDSWDCHGFEAPTLAPELAQ